MTAAIAEKRDPNGNTAYPCVDCRETPVVTLVQHVVINGKVKHWHICVRCFLRDQERSKSERGAA